jgi:hypothetical protein
MEHSNWDSGISNDRELELRKWALEFSVKHGNDLFPQYMPKRPSEIISNAKKIINLLQYNWDNEFNDSCDQDNSPILRSNP